MAKYKKRVTLHPLKEDGTMDLDTNLYPKTFLDGIVDRDGNEVDVALKEEIPTDFVTHEELDDTISDLSNTYATKEYVDTKPNLVEITWFALKSLRDNSQLVPGRFYRITDFVTTTAQARTSSAGHQFDLIVQAIANNKLSEDAQACLHSGDTYFANSKLSAWEIKYCLDNDTNRFLWADSVNGKGVISYLKDEFDNVAHYDFKNIQFARYEITACENCQSLVGKFCGILDIDGNQILTNYMTIDTSSYKYYYTFDCCGVDYSMNAIGTTLTRPDGETFTLDQIQCLECSITLDERDSGRFCLNNFVVALESSRDCRFQITDWCESSMFLGGSNQFSIKSFVNSIAGIGASVVDGYVGFVGSRINSINSSLIICTTAGRAIFYRSNVDAIDSSCIVSLDNTFTMSAIDIIALSTIISNTEACFVYSKLHYMGYCDLKSEKTTIMRSNILAIVQCHISVSEYVIERSFINVMQYCDCDSSKGIKIYVTQSICNHLGSISVTNTTEGNYFILNSHIIGCNNCSLKLVKACNITVLHNSTFGEIKECNFKNNKGLTCSQDLICCNFEGGVNYVTISSSDISQTITNTNFHDVHGEENNIKTLVIPEDYSTTHTVNIYGAPQKDIILN